MIKDWKISRWQSISQNVFWKIRCAVNTITRRTIIWNKKSFNIYLEYELILPPPLHSLLSYYFRFLTVRGPFKQKMRFCAKFSAIFQVKNYLNMKMEKKKNVGGRYFIPRKYVPSLKRIGRVVFAGSCSRTSKNWFSEKRV